MPHNDSTEHFCNQVAAEFLIPGHKLLERWEKAKATVSPFWNIARWFKVDLDNSAANSFYLAAWVGALVTSLNLIPVGQLDGGHGVFAVFGKTAHYWIARAMFVGMVALSVLGWLWYRTPMWFLFVVLLLVMLRVGHPQPQRMEPLGLPRIIIAIVTLIVFVLCFLPFPITFS